ncbi:MAG: thioredoxin fold domain-containing protein [Balneolaceae bacterium]
MHISKRIIATLIFIFTGFTVIHAQSELVWDTGKPDNDSEKSTVMELYDWKSMEKAQELAAENGKKVLVYANARWCTYCKKMEKEVFTLQDVQDITNEYFYLVWIDLDSDEQLTFRNQEMSQAEFGQVMRVTGTPTFIFIDEEGEIIAGQPGYIPGDIYTQILEFVGSDAYLVESFEDFVGN